MSDLVYRREIDCHIRSLYPDEGGDELVNLDLEAVGIPEDISDSYSANYGDMNALGRSSPMVDYANGGPREISFSIMLREDKTPAGMDIVDVVNEFKSLAYPEYADVGYVEPPVIKFYLGDIFDLRGVCTSVDVNWEGPYGDSKRGRDTFYQAEVSLSFTEVPRTVKSASDIRSVRG